MSARRTAALTATTAALTAWVLTGAATTASAASDAPTPYRVTGTALELPPGATLQVHGHVNVVYTSADGTGARNVHIEGPGTRFGDLAGASVLTWERAGLPQDACITWVQVGGYDEHFGEGGQAPVCRTDVPAAPPATPVTPAAPAAPGEGTSPAEPAAPAAEPAAPAAPPAAEVAVPLPAPEQTPAPAAAAPEPAPTAEVAAEAAPAPAPTARAEVLAAVEPTPTPSAGTAAAATERSEVLAATGARTGALLGGAALALGLGTALVLWRRRRTP